MSQSWLNGPGAFWIVALIFGGTSIFFVAISVYLAKKFQSPGEGCLLVFGNILFVLIGGFAGMRLVPYPASMLTSLFGAFVLPAALTWKWLRTATRKQGP